MGIGRQTKTLLLAATMLAEFTSSTAALAQTAAQAEQAFSLEAQSLGTALSTVAKQTGREIMFPAHVVEGRQAPRLQGHYTPDEAIRRLLKGSGLVAEYRAEVVLVRGRSDTPGALAEGAEAPGTDIVVTGSRIRGAPIASPVIELSQTQMLEAGQYTLADAIRTIPQNYGGGQTPGVAFGVPGSSGENVGGASSINLRGIGQDATLTLLNGHRMAYGGYRQNVDVSAIPLGAIERVEIVADGASALYGSDAVAGVANIILKPDYRGLETSAKFGVSTDGGNEQQQYSVVGGSNWGSGGFIAAYDFGRDTSILSRQRAYTAIPNPGLTLYPALKHHSVLLSAHQAITSTVTADVDALYNLRKSQRGYSLTGDSNSPRYVVPERTESFTVAPALHIALPSQWQASLVATYGSDRVHYGTDQILGEAVTPLQRSCFCNTSWSVEANADGALFRLPGGDAKIALGGGYRSNALHALTTVGGSTDIDVSQGAYFAFGEINLPLISSDQQIAGIHRLNLSGAIRYEDYPGIDRVATPILAQMGIAALCVNNNNATQLERSADGSVIPLVSHKASLASYQAAIDILARQGLIDRSRVGIAGHSYSSNVVERRADERLQGGRAHDRGLSEGQSPARR